MSLLFLAWRDPNSRAWFPIGRLEATGEAYEFSYTQGALEAKDRCNFEPLPMFPDFHTVYESDELFPLFTNRAPASNREDYFEIVEQLNLPSSPHDPMAILARSGGRRATDAFEVFPCPSQEEDGFYRIHFFVHGISHLSDHAREFVEKLNVGEKLLVMWDMQNTYDPAAFALRTDRENPQDRTIVGYCPRYLTEDWRQILTGCGTPNEAEIRVEKLNPPSTPLAFRVLCRLEGCWPVDFKPCSGEMFRSVATAATSPE